MDFFDKLGGKIAGASQGVASQTKNLTGGAKMNMTISNNEKEILDLYSNIGKLFYEANKDSQDCLAIEMIQRINFLVQENAQLKQSVNLLKGIIICQGCGNEISNKNFCCNFCGIPVPQPVQPMQQPMQQPVQPMQPMQQPMQQPVEAMPNAAVCKTCGSQIEQDSKFCFNCGQMV